MKTKAATTVSDEVHYDVQTFEKIKIQLQQVVDSVIFAPNTKISVEQIAHGLLIRLQQEIMGQHHYQEYTVMQPIPANWWETFKEERMPQWYVRRYPVKRRFARHTVAFDHKKLFPKPTIKIPDSMGPVFHHSHALDPNVTPNY